MDNPDEEAAIFWEKKTNSSHFTDYTLTKLEKTCRK